MPSFRQRSGAGSSSSIRPTRSRASSSASPARWQRRSTNGRPAFAGWYPIKDQRDVDGPAAIIADAAPGKALRLELMIDSPAEPDRLNGCGLFVANPPWTLAAEAETILPALAERLARGRYGGFLRDAGGARRGH